jgi:hypothetical protein
VTYYMAKHTCALAAASTLTLALAVGACSTDRQTPTAPTVTTPPTSSLLPLPPGVPGPYTLSGVISEATPNGRSPLSGAEVEVGVCPPPNHSPPSYMKTVTDTNGTYSVSGMCTGTTYVWVSKEGFRTNPTAQCDGDCLFARINGDTRFDIELVRR